jgi:hypothetical protein
METIDTQTSLVDFARGIIVLKLFFVSAPFMGADFACMRIIALMHSIRVLLLETCSKKGQPNRESSPYLKYEI